MTFDELIRYKALHLKYVSDNQGLMDMIALDEVEHNIPMKNVCAMVSQQLFDSLTNTCSLLDISKRTFIEGALIEALNKAEKIIEEEGIFERLAQEAK
jgi:hypothetical protein